MPAAGTRRRAATKKSTTRAKAKPVEVEDEIDELEEAEVEEVPAAKPTRRKPARKAPAKKTPVEDVDEEDEEDDEEEKAPAKVKRKPPTRRVIEFGTQWLVDLISDKTGKDYKPYDLRVLLRKMAKAGELDREIGSDKGRYEFEGPNDPVVKAIIAKVKKGEIEKGRKESLEKLKERTAGKKKASKKAREEDVEDEEIEDDVDELDDDEDYEDDDE